MRLSDLTDEALEQLAADHERGAAWPHTQDRCKATSLANAAIVHELLDRRRADALRKRTDPAMKLAIAHVEMLRDYSVATGSNASIACLDFQLKLLKGFIEPESTSTQHSPAEKS